jgi:hypothetical protein
VTAKMPSFIQDFSTCDINCIDGADVFSLHWNSPYMSFSLHYGSTVESTFWSCNNLNHYLMMTQPQRCFRQFRTYFLEGDLYVKTWVVNYMTLVLSVLQFFICGYREPLNYFRKY